MRSHRLELCLSSTCFVLRQGEVDLRRYTFVSQPTAKDVLLGRRAGGEWEVIRFVKSSLVELGVFKDYESAQRLYESETNEELRLVQASRCQTTATALVPARAATLVKLQTIAVVAGALGLSMSISFGLVLSSLALVLFFRSPSA